MGLPVKAMLTRVGAVLSRRSIHFANAAVNYLEVGRWMAARGFVTRHRVADRAEVFRRIATEIGDGAALYLEFGVYRGESMKLWSSLLRSPQAHLHGFDSFEGLPEDWTHENPRGHFDVAGVIPKIADPRVQFFPGWFDRTLLTYQPPAHDVLIINCDADLYSSTKTVLDHFEDDILVGTYLYFDEFSDRNHELRAFDEFLDRGKMGFRLVGATDELSHVAFQRIS